MTSTAAATGAMDPLDALVRSNERMLTDGFYAAVTLVYDPVIA
ncbi:MAG: hypothetical protein ACK5N0_10235 [Synechococcaceae cyanobacterium]